MKLRLVHRTDRWIGQAKANDTWEDYTNEHDTEQEAELNLLRLITEDSGFLFEPTLEL
jgi:hypothetical protein